MKKVYLKNEYIMSMKALIGRYENAIRLGISKQQYEKDNGMSCLLCCPVGVHMKSVMDSIWKTGPKVAGCDICPWKVIDGVICVDVYNDGGECVFESSDVEYMQSRIDQLVKWIKKYETYEDIKIGGV